MIKFHCPGCGQKLAVKDALAGKRTKCPSCGDPVSIPHVSADMFPAPDPEPVLVPASAAAAPAPVQAPSVAPARVHVPASSPFGFDPAPRVTMASVETAPSVTLDTEAFSVTSAAPRRRRPSSVKTWAGWGAVTGAVGAALLAHFVHWTDENLVAALGQLFKQAGSDEIRGVLLGAIGGLAVAGMLLLLLGRSGATISGALLLIVGGGMYGGMIRKSGFGEFDFPMLVLVPLAGLIAGAILGAITGAIVAANSAKNSQYASNGD